MSQKNTSKINGIGTGTFDLPTERKALKSRTKSKNKLNPLMMSDQGSPNPGSWVRDKHSSPHDPGSPGA